MHTYADKMAMLRYTEVHTFVTQFMSKKQNLLSQIIGTCENKSNKQTKVLNLMKCNCNGKTVKNFKSIML
jgi:hypothetical protein